MVLANRAAELTPGIVEGRGSRARPRVPARRVGFLLRWANSSDHYRLEEREALTLPNCPWSGPFKAGGGTGIVLPETELVAHPAVAIIESVGSDDLDSRTWRMQG